MKTGTFLAIAFLWLSLPACSVYHDARDALPASADQRLELRLKAAQEGEAEAVKAVREYGISGTSLEVDMDRVDRAAREFNRRVLAAEDVRTSATAAQSEALGRFRRRSDSLTEIVAAIRAHSSDPPTERLRQWTASDPSAPHSN